MKKLLLANLSILVIILGLFSFAEARVSVRGSFRKSGTYVAPHYRTSPNHTKLDNYSTQGNSNPYTGENGYASPYKTYRHK